MHLDVSLVMVNKNLDAAKLPGQSKCFLGGNTG